MRLQPLHDRVVVKKLEAPDRKGGLWIPETAKEQPQLGLVLEVGTGRLLMDGGESPLHVHIGDKILFGKYSGTEITVDDKEVLILREDEILGIIIEDEDDDDVVDDDADDLKDDADDDEDDDLDEEED
jgi:chaperonin GroES